MKKPVIGITSAYLHGDFYNENIGMYNLPQGYARSVIEAGGIPFMLPYTSDEEVLRGIVDICDGFLFAGGHDVDPALYGEMPWYKLGELAPLRDMTESRLMPLVLESRKPVIGHCRGMQMMNALLGGTLYQDLPSQYPHKENLIDHGQKTPSIHPCHRVSFVPGSFIHSCFGDSAMVNSFHHQAVKDIAPGLEVTAVAEDGVIEALTMPDHPFLNLVQWHPEEMTSRCAGSRAWFRKFIEACV